MLSRVRRLLESREEGGGNYPYVTSRVRALKTHLLPEEEYPKLIARDVHEIARTLEEGRYKQEINELASTFSGAALIERATRVNLGRELRRILSWCTGEPKMLLRLYMQRYDVHNVKTVLRGAKAGADREETQAALIPAGVVPEDRYVAALSAQNVEEAITALADTPYGRVVADLDADDVPAMENALDIAYFDNLTSTVDPSDRPKEALLDFLRREVDVVNLKLVLRARHADLDQYELVPGGREITEDIARRVRGAQWDEVPAILDETVFGDVLRDPLARYQEDRDLNQLANAIETVHLDAAESFSHLYPLSILPIIDYVLRKEREVDRIRMIAFGKQAGLSKEDIEELVEA